MEIVIQAFDRIPPEMLARLAGCNTSAVANLGVRSGVPTGIFRMAGSGVAFGSALTARAAPGDNLAAHVALTEVRQGDFLLLAAHPGNRCAVVGDRIAAMAANGGAAGIVTDGLARDLAAIRNLGTSLHACGVSPLSPGRTGPAVVGGTITIGGVEVRSGDLVVADDDGVAVVPAEAVASAAEALERHLHEEGVVQLEIDAGAKYPRWIDGLVAAARRLPVASGT